jgi:hypothetical protein
MVADFLPPRSTLQNFYSSQSEQNTPPNPCFVACISLHLNSFFPDRQIDADFLLHKVDDRLISCSTHIQGTQECSTATSWTTSECFSAVFAMRGPPFCKFGHLFVDAEQASDSALVERISWAQNITWIRWNALTWLVPAKHFG